MRDYTVLWTELSVQEVPAEAVDFVPGEFGLKLSMCQCNNPEALSGVGLQSVCESLRDCTEKHNRYRFHPSIFKSSAS